MDLRVGSNLFEGVTVPVLWGERAVLQDARGKLSVVDLGRDAPVLEILGDRPAPGAEFKPRLAGGFTILGAAGDLYAYDPKDHLLTPIELKLPELQITESFTRIGSHTLSSNMVVGFGVGVLVNEEGISIGGPVPERLTRLRAS